jgi:DNA polymerase I-like protein with 3'-5' exonuclease and polymerase domains
LGIASDVSERVVEQISSLFPNALSFVAEYEQQVKKDGFAKDVFGKRRSSFESGKEYLARNFAVQSPAATICLEKLIKLHYSLSNLNQFLKHKVQIAYTVHDGYVLYITKENWKDVLKKSLEVLMSESEICPGLKLKVSCKGGRTLDDMKIIKK